MAKNKSYIRGSLGKPFNNNNIGSNLRKLRLLNDIKQQELAKVLGISRQMLSHYENNKYPVPEIIVQRIILHFHISLESLLSNSKLKA